MKWRFRKTEVAGSSATLLVSALMMAVLQPPSVQADAAPALTLSNNTEVLPPGALVMRGPNAASAGRSTASTNASTALSVVPASLRLPTDLAEVVRLKTAGLPDDTILAYIQNSPPLSPVTPAQIVYLKDLGLSPRVVLAMLQHQRAAPGATPPPAAPTYPGSQEAAESENPPADMTAEEMAATVPEGYEEAAALPGPGYFNPIEYGYVYNALTPYGSWLNLPGCGWCWQPTVGTTCHGWRPYCDNGRWRWSDCGWYWDSQYTWGRVPFHYGRWWQHANYGWLWRPDPVWGPAWVSWRSSGDACGWAPLPPGADFSVGTGWTFRGRPADSARGGFGLAADAFTFVNREHFLKPAGHRLGARETQEAFRHSTPAERNGFAFGAGQRLVNLGIDPFLAETAAHRAVRPAPVTFPGGAGFSDVASSRQLPFNGQRRADRGGGGHAESAASAPDPTGSPGRGGAPAWSSSAPPGGHVPQYPATRTLAELGNGPLPMGAQAPAGAGPQPATGSKPALTPTGPAAGATVVFPFGKPAAGATGGARSGGAHK